MKPSAVLAVLLSASLPSGAFARNYAASRAAVAAKSSVSGTAGTVLVVPPTMGALTPFSASAPSIAPSLTVTPGALVTQIVSPISAVPSAALKIDAVSALPAPLTPIRPANPPALALTLRSADSPAAKPDAPKSKGWTERLTAPILNRLEALRSEVGENTSSGVGSQGFWKTLLSESRGGAAETAAAPAGTSDLPSSGRLTRTAKALQAALRVDRWPGRRPVGELLHGDPEVRPYVRKFYKRMAAASAIMILSGIGGMLQMRLLGGLTDAAIARHGGDAALFFAACLGVHLLFVGIDIYQHKMMALMRVKLTQDVQSGLFHNLLQQPSPLLSRQNPAELSARLVNDLGQIPVKNINSRVALPYLLAMLGMSAAALLHTSVMVVVIAALFAPLIIWLSLRYAKLRQSREAAYAAQRAALSRAGEAGLAAEREAKLQGAEAQQAGLYNRKAEDFMQAANGLNFLAINNDIGIGFLRHFAAYFVVLGVGILNLVLYGTPSMGEILSMTGYAGALSGAIHGLLTLNTDNRAAGGTTGKVLELLRSSSGKADRLPGAIVAGPLQDALRLEGVSGARQGQPSALQGADLAFAAGRRSAVVDVDGSDLQELPALLLRLEEPAAGRLTYDGAALSAVSLSSLRRRVTLIDSRSRLLPGTLRENLLYARPDADEASLRSALEAVGAAAVLDPAVLPQGLDTEINAAEQRLGAGLRRLLLARAFLQDPSVLILASPGAGLDGMESSLFDLALEKLAKGRTTIWIWPKSQRLNSMDRIFLLKDGAVLEAGSPAELSTSPAYRKLLETLL